MQQLPFSEVTSQVNEFPVCTQLAHCSDDNQLKLPRYDAFAHWLGYESPFVRELDLHGRAPNATAFTQWVKFFLEEPSGVYFQDSVVFGEDRITETKISCYSQNIKDGATAMATVDNVRRAVEESAPIFDPGAYSLSFLFYDGYRLIAWETVRNVLMAGVVVFILTTIVLADVVASIIVTLMIALTDIMLFGEFCSIAYSSWL